MLTPEYGLVTRAWLRAMTDLATRRLQAPEHHALRAAELRGRSFIFNFPLCQPLNTHSAIQNDESSYETSREGFYLLV